MYDKDKMQMSQDKWFHRFFPREVLGQAFRFCLVGIIATALHYVAYLGLKNLINVTAAFVIGYGVSFIANYFLSAYFTFQRQTSFKTGLGFLCAHLVNLAIQTGLLHAFIRMGLSSTWAPIPVYAIAVPVNFLLVRSVFSRL